MRNPLSHRKQQRRARRPHEVVVGGMASRDILHTDAPGLDLPERIWAMGSTNYSAWKNGLMLGGEGVGGGERLPNPNPADDRELTYGSGRGGAILGVQIVRRGPIRIYPLIGIGGGGSGAAYVPHVEPGQAPGAKPPRPEPIAGNGGVHLRVGVGIELRIGGRAGVFVGFRIGYVFMPIRFGSARSAAGGPFSNVVFGVYYRR